MERLCCDSILEVCCLNEIALQPLLGQSCCLLGICVSLFVQSGEKRLSCHSVLGVKAISTHSAVVIVAERVTPDGTTPTAGFPACWEHVGEVTGSN